MLMSSSSCIHPAKGNVGTTIVGGMIKQPMLDEPEVQLHKFLIGLIGLVGQIAADCALRQCSGAQSNQSSTHVYGLIMSQYMMAARVWHPLVASAQSVQSDVKYDLRRSTSHLLDQDCDINRHWEALIVKGRRAHMT